MSGFWPALFVTGASGTIGSVVRQHWRGRLTGFDLPYGDARDLWALQRAAAGHDAIVHLAWDTGAENYQNDGFSPENLVMTVNALRAARHVGVRRVVLASSVHAEAFCPPARAPSSEARHPVPDSLYGSSKVFVETVGRFAAATWGIEVVAVRFGGVNRLDQRPAELAERAVWLRHADCALLIQAAVTQAMPASGFALVVGVSESCERVHEWSNDLSWQPPVPSSKLSAAS